MPDETTDIRVKLENHEQRIVSAEHRLKDLETDSKVIMQLSNSVQKLAINMEQMLEEQKEQGARLKALEDEPIETWNNAKRTAFTSIVSTLAGALASSLIWLLVHGGV